MLIVGLALSSAHAQPLFQSDDNALLTQSCNGGGCWTNHLRVDDLDGDGDLDVIFTNYEGFFQRGSPQPLAVYTNDGTGTFTDVSALAVGGHIGRIRQVALGDIDADGDLDLYAPDGAGDPGALFVNDGTGVFTDEALTRLPPLSANVGAVRFGDVDGDGDLDLVVGDGYAQGNGAQQHAHLLLNDGAGTFTDASAQLPTSTRGVDPDDIDLLDVDRDFDLDILINPHSGDNSLWVNDGTGTFTDATAGLASQPGGFHYNPSACDVDGDGDLDLWIDNMGPGYAEQLLINDGTGVFTDETSARVSGNTGDDDNGVACIDVDQDGDFDAVIWSLGSKERILMNDGTGTFSFTNGAIEAVRDPSLWGSGGDLDADGVLDLVTGQGEGSPERNLVYRGTAYAPVDTLPPMITHQQAPGELVPVGTEVTVRFAVRDAVVHDGGPRLDRAFARGDFGAGVVELDGHFIGGDLFTVTLPGLGDGFATDVSLCAIDRAGNEGCGDPQPYTAEGTPNTTPSGTTTTPPGTTTTPPGTTDPGTNPTGDSGDGGAATVDGTGGCGCDATSPAPVGAVLLTLGLLAARRR